MHLSVKDLHIERWRIKCRTYQLRVKSTSSPCSEEPRPTESTHSQDSSANRCTGRAYVAIMTHFIDVCLIVVISSLTAHSFQISLTVRHSTNLSIVGYFTCMCLSSHSELIIDFRKCRRVFKFCLRLFKCLHCSSFTFTESVCK